LCRQQFTHRLFCLAIILQGLAVSAWAQESWPGYQRDPQHTGLYPDGLDPASLTLKWESPVTDWGYAQPLIVGQSVYAADYHQSGSTSPAITSFDLADGRVNWTDPGVPFIGGAAGGLAYADGKIVYTDGYANAPQLRVLDAGSGKLLYSVKNVFGTFGGPAPTLAHDPSGHLIAYVGSNGGAQAVRLDANSGTVLWSEPGQFGGLSTPTVIESSVVLAGPGEYASFDRNTGNSNYFFTSPLSGGGGSTAVYDSQRKQFYVPGVGALSAYSYADNTHITHLWDNPFAGFYVNEFANLGPDGKVYAATYSMLKEIDPLTGATTRSIAGNFWPNAPMLIAGDYLYLGGAEVQAYDLRSFTLAASFDDPTRPGLYTPAAVDDSHLLIDFQDGVGTDRRFMVYSTPEPSTAAVLLLAIPLLARRSRRGRRDHPRPTRCSCAAGEPIAN
jgi:outer membrane protein assembly factor BamB